MNFKQSFNCSHWDKVRRPPSARGGRKQTEKCNSSWVVAQTGSRGVAVACWEMEAMAAPGSWRLGCCRWKGASVGGAMDLLAGGDHLAVLDFLHDGPHLAGGHRACGRRGRDTHRTSGWRPSLSPPTQKGPQPLPTHPGQDGAGSYLPGWAERPGTRSTGWTGCRKRGSCQPRGAGGESSPLGGVAAGEAEGSEVPGNRREITAWGTQQRMPTTGSEGQAQWAGIRKADTPTGGPEALCCQPGIYKEKLRECFFFFSILKGPINKLH